jgi:thioesterase domain-containing protein
VRRLLLAVLLLAAGAGGCGSNGHVAERNRAKASPPPALGGVRDTSRLVTVGDGRSLFLDCIGSGSPTIVLEAGFGGNTHDWDAVEPGLGETTRTCAYDRAGIGNSVAGTGVRNAAEEIDDLAHLLTAAHIDPPYVLVGHSYGGLLVRLFAQAHAQETAGIVLVDSMGRNQTQRTMAITAFANMRAASALADAFRSRLLLVRSERLTPGLADARLAILVRDVDQVERGDMFLLSSLGCELGAVALVTQRRAPQLGPDQGSASGGALDSPAFAELVDELETEAATVVQVGRAWRDLSGTPGVLNLEA